MWKTVFVLNMENCGKVGLILLFYLKLEEIFKINENSSQILQHYLNFIIVCYNSEKYCQTV